MEKYKEKHVHEINPVADSGHGQYFLETFSAHGESSGMTKRNTLFKRSAKKKDAQKDLRIRICVIKGRSLIP